MRDESPCLVRRIPVPLGSRWMCIRVARRDIRLVEFKRAIDQQLRHVVVLPKLNAQRLAFRTIDHFCPSNLTRSPMSTVSQNS